MAPEELFSRGAEKFRKQGFYLNIYRLVLGCHGGTAWKIAVRKFLLNTPAMRFAAGESPFPKSYRGGVTKSYCESLCDRAISATETIQKSNSSKRLVLNIVSCRCVGTDQPSG